MATIGFVTCADLPAMPESDVLTAADLSRLGHSVMPVRWDGDDAADEVELLVFRSCWNYHLHAEAFRLWVGEMAENGRRLLNPRKTILWNMDKRYLSELGARIPVVPTEVILAPTPADIDSVRRRRGWQELIIKPSIGASAYQSRRLLTNEDFAELDSVDLPQVALVQPYLRQIQSHGEFALIFFDGIYSHAVLKRPVEGDYRVQEEFGGLVVPTEPPDAVLRVALRTIEFLPEPPLYARIDIVVGDSGPMVMELELIEPELYIDRVPEAAARFAEAIQAGLKTGTRGAD